MAVVGTVADLVERLAKSLRMVAEVLLMAVGLVTTCHTTSIQDSLAGGFDSSVVLAVSQKEFVPHQVLARSLFL